MCRDVTLWDAIRITSCNIPNLQLVSPKILCCELQRKLKHLLIFGKLRDHAVQTFNNTNCLASFGEGTNYTMLNRRWNRPSDIQQIWHPASDIQQICIIWQSTDLTSSVWHTKYHKILALNISRKTLQAFIDCPVNTKTFIWRVIKLFLLFLGPKTPFYNKNFSFNFRFLISFLQLRREEPGGYWILVRNIIAQQIALSNFFTFEKNFFYNIVYYFSTDLFKI